MVRGIGEASLLRRWADAVDRVRRAERGANPVAAPPPTTAKATRPIGDQFCGDDEAAATVPLSQRFLTAEDAPGSKPDPVEQGRTAADLDEFVAVFEIAIDPDTEEMTTLFQEAGFKEAGEDSRFLGETHRRRAPHLISSFIELGSEDGARSALGWLESEWMRPCPGSCAVQISTFDLDGIADAHGVRRLATAQDNEKVGTEDQQPHDHYLVGSLKVHSSTRWSCWDPRDLCLRSKLRRS
jgi:hypothetical protein